LSPVLGFLLSGVILGPHGFRLVKDVEDIKHLADFGVLFLLFEMGLELSIERLRKLRKYAFGLGSLQMIITGSIFWFISHSLGASIPESFVIGGKFIYEVLLFILVKVFSINRCFGHVFLSLCIAVVRRKRRETEQDWLSNVWHSAFTRRRCSATFSYFTFDAKFPVR